MHEAALELFGWCLDVVASVFKGKPAGIRQGLAWLQLLESCLSWSTLRIILPFRFESSMSSQEMLSRSRLRNFLEVLHGQLLHPVPSSDMSQSLRPA